MREVKYEGGTTYIETLPLKRKLSAPSTSCNSSTSKRIGYAESKFNRQKGHHHS